MPPDLTPHSREPAPGHETQDAGSVVVGLDPSAPGGVFVTIDPDRLRKMAGDYARMREAVLSAVPAIVAATQAVETAMRHFSEAVSGSAPGGDETDGPRPADGEDTPPCPA